MKLTINGKIETLENIKNLSDIITHFKLKNVVIELNGNIINKEDYPDTLLKEDDRIEIIRFVGGG